MHVNNVCADICIKQMLQRLRQIVNVHHICFDMSNRRTMNGGENSVHEQFFRSIVIFFKLIMATLRSSGKKICRRLLTGAVAIFLWPEELFDLSHVVSNIRRSEL